MFPYMSVSIQSSVHPLPSITIIDQLQCNTKTLKCDRILENNSKSHMKSSVFLHVFNDISTCAYVPTEYFLHSFSNLSIEFHLML